MQFTRALFGGAFCKRLGEELVFRQKGISDFVLNVVGAGVFVEYS